MSLDSSLLRPHYSAFLGQHPGRVLLTGHSHQAWPDVAKVAMVEAFDLAAAHVDDKWSHVFSAQDELRTHIAARLACGPSEIAFAPNTHELLVRFLSAMPLRARPRIVTTTGEFHSAFRQLTRLTEEGVEVVFVEAEPAATLAERVLHAVDERTSAVIMSTVLFESATVVHGADALVTGATAKGAHVLLDAYHAFDAVPMRVPSQAFLVAGGYKYAQWGEGLCFLRVPPGIPFRPIYTGWFAGFAELAHHRDRKIVGYAEDGGTRFAGSTFDPVSTLRARAVARFFDAQGMTVEALRETSLAKTERILHAAESLPHVTVVTPRAASDRGGFVALRTPRASELCDLLRKDSVFADSRGDVLRLGPAPYVTSEEIDRAMGCLRARLG
jgi:selenocysteine lyase/cysteine desulfurase